MSVQTIPARSPQSGSASPDGRTHLALRPAVLRTGACLRRIALASLLPAALVAAPSLAADIVVNSSNDNAPTPADCKLRSAVIAANTDAPHGGCTAGDGADRIVFDGVSSIRLQNTALEVADELIIDGRGRPVRIRRASQDQNRFRIIEVTDDVERPTLTLRNISIESGLIDASVSGQKNGAGILSPGHVQLEDSRVVDNTITASSGSGGGIDAGTLSLLRSEVSGNHATDSGGGASAVRITLVDSTVADNTTDDPNAQGAGLYAQDAVDCIRSSLVGNQGGAFGGGAFALLVTLRNCTVSGNASQFGGGISGFVINVQHSTITDNLASDNASGGIAAATSDDFAHSVSISNSIVAGNVGDIAAVVDPVFVAGTNIIVGPVANNVDLPVGAIDCDPQLEPLADNGGPTQTHAFAAGSCAHEAGSNPFDEAVDQRGLPRTSGAATDIGAYELQASELFADGFE